MKNSTDINFLIIRLLSGDADEDEKEIISDWLSQSEKNIKLYKDLEEIWLSSEIQNNADDYNLEEAIRNFREQISNQKLKKNYTLNLVRILKIASIVLLMLALPFSYYIGTHNSISNDSMTTISCAFGDKSSIVLPDSTKVWLNSGSKLSFSSKFKKEDRKVILEGEAFFSVSKDKKHPFRVKTTELDIEVLGTKFDLKAYPEERSVSTTLVEGSIKISSKYQQTLIKPNQKIVFDKASKEMSLQEITDISIDTDWRDGRLSFRNESLGELKPILERWFDVDILFADEQVKNRRFTGVLQRESILEAISYFDHSRYVSCKIQGNKIIIKSENN
jgi:transmembrane sensor